MSKHPKLPGRRPPLLPGLTRGNALRRIGLAIAATLGWFLALGSLQGWIDVRELLREKEEWFRDDLVFINRDVSLTDSVGITSAHIGPETLARLRTVEGVIFAEPVERNRFPAAIEIGGGVIPALASEIFLEAVDDSLLPSDGVKWDWTPYDSLVPVLVPRQFLNLYDFGFAPGKGLPVVSEAVAKRVRFSLIVYPEGDRTPIGFTASIAGFSDRIESILVPWSFLSWANERFGKNDNNHFARVAVALQNPDSKEFHRFLADNRLLASQGARDSARLRLLLDLGLAILGTAGAIILGLILVLSLAEVESLINDHRDRIRKLYFLGHPPAGIMKRMVRLRLAGSLIPALIGVALLWICRRPVVLFLQEAGLTVGSSPAPGTLGVWAGLLLLINLFLFLRIRNRLIRLYQ